ncbi:centromere protein Chl4/mis15/CENP-N [Coniochaeta sp. 2T2.1]|nr:centromere protein Chl4/mis15/CENP-N [Coniochaeta sp. 2T2.1]
MQAISIPTSARLASTVLVSHENPVVVKALNRLSRPCLISIVLNWLDENKEELSDLSAPILVDHRYKKKPEEVLEPAKSIEELHEIYKGLQARKGSRREIVERITDCDWQDGLTLYQLAMVDLAYLKDHPASQKWSAYRIVPLRTPASNAEAEAAPKIDKESLTIPRFHPTTFLRQLQAQFLPDVKAHFNFEIHETLPLLLLRIFILDSPYNTDLAATPAGGDRLTPSSDSSRTIYVAFPDSSPHIFISNSQGARPTLAGEAKSLRSLLVEGIPKALSRPRERYTLKSTSLSTRNLNELVHRRGSGKTNAVGGGWSIYADPRKRVSPLDSVLPTPPPSDGDDASEGKGKGKRAASPDTEREERAIKRARKVAQARFGDTAKVDDGKGVERVDIVIEDPFRVERRKGKVPERGGLSFPQAQDGEDDGEEGERPREARAGRRSTVQEILTREREDGDEEEQDEEDAGGKWRPNVRLTFHGTHVFAGIRQLVEHAVIDGERMPGWMTGEEGVTIGAVRHGRIRGHKGSGV